MKIKNALVFNGRGFEKRDLCIRGERISEESSFEEQIPGERRSEERGPEAQVLEGQVQEITGKEFVLDAEGLYAIPGLIDIHFHGALGHDFCDADERGLQKIAEYEAANGVLAICPATMTYSEEKLIRVMECAAAYKRKMTAQKAITDASGEREAFTETPKEEEDNSEGAFRKGAELVGIHLEGPFLSPNRLGAQNPDYVKKPDAVMAKRLIEKSEGLVRLLDIAPETEGAMTLIKELSKEKKVRISLAHTNANYETAKEAFKNGADHMTHLFNAMPGIHHRMPGPIIAAHEAAAFVELITDGIHLHPAIVRFVFEYFGDDRVILVSDTMEGVGLPDGTYRLGGQDVVKKGRKAVLKSDETIIAGSVTNLFDCFRITVKEMGVPLESALKAVTVNPAKAIGIEEEYGTLETGKVANILLLDEELRIREILLRGRRISPPN